MTFLPTQFRQLLLSFLIVTMALLAGCDRLVKISEPKKAPFPQSITLPSGERVRLSEHAAGSEEGRNSWQEHAKEKAQICVESICQIEESFVYRLEDETYFLSADERSRLPKAERAFEAEIWPKLRQVIEAVRSDNLDSNRRLLNLISRVPTDRPINTSPITQIFLKYALALKPLKNYKWNTHYDQEKFIKTQKITLKDSVMKELTATERQEIEISLIIFNRYLKDYIINSDLSIIERSGLRIYILYKYGTSDFNKSKQKFLNDMKEKSNLIKTHSPLFHKIISDNLTMQKVLNGEDLLPVEESSLKQTLSTLYLFADFIENPWAEFNDVKLDFDTLLNGQQLVERIKQYVAINSEENEVIRHEASLKKTYGICKKSFSSHLVSRPNENQLKTVNQLISKVKSSAEGVAKKLFDTVSQEEIKTLTQGILFTLPSTQEEAPSQILKAIQALAKIASETGLKNFDELSDEETENILGLFVAITESETDEIDDEYSSVSDFCLKYIPESLSDSSVTVENRIFTSAKTVKAAMQGVGIIAHEAAHRLYRDLSGKPQAALLTCLKNRHFGSLSSEVTSINREKYMSEDFADQFSSMVLKDLGYTAPENNLACLFFHKAKWNEDNAKLPFFSSIVEHPLVSSEDDDHSADTFRLLQLAADLGHSTEVCQEFALAEGNKTYLNEGGNSLVLPTIQQCIWPK